MGLKKLSLFVLLILLPLIGFSSRESFSQVGQSSSTPRPTLPGTMAPTVPAVPTVSPPQVQRPLNLVVTVTMGNGTSETFSREIESMEIVTVPNGRVETVHLILVSDGERKTHVWYNYSNVAKLSYRFVTKDGRDRVKVRIVHKSQPSRELTDRLDPLGPQDYR